MLPDLTKPPRGSGRLERKAKRNAIRSYEDEQKAIVRRRDGAKCRWPHCRHPKGTPLEVAHLHPKGLGGDHSARSRADLMIHLCHFHHQADAQEGHPEGSIERHTLKIEPLTDLGSDGPCRFLRQYVTVEPTGMVETWVEVGRERSRGVLEKRR